MGCPACNCICPLGTSGPHLAAVAVFSTAFILDVSRYSEGAAPAQGLTFCPGPSLRFIWFCCQGDGSTLPRSSSQAQLGGHKGHSLPPFAAACELGRALCWPFPIFHSQKHKEVPFPGPLSPERLADKKQRLGGGGSEKLLPERVRSPVCSWLQRKYFPGLPFKH